MPVPNDNWKMTSSMPSGVPGPDAGKAGTGLTSAPMPPATTLSGVGAQPGMKRSSSLDKTWFAHFRPHQLFNGIQEEMEVKSSTTSFTAPKQESAVPPTSVPSDDLATFKALGRYMTRRTSLATAEEFQAKPTAPILARRNSESSLLKWFTTPQPSGNLTSASRDSSTGNLFMSSTIGDDTASARTLNVISPSDW